MNSGKIANMIQITNSTIDVLNSRLSSHNVNQFYHVAEHDTRADYVTLMIEDLDFLMVRSDIEDPEVDTQYLKVRRNLKDLEKRLKEKYNHKTQR